MAQTDALVACKALHDRLLAEKPEGADHDSETCVLCAMSDTTVTTDPEGTTTEDARGGSMSDKTYTEAELKAALEEQTAAMTARIKDLEASHQESEVEAAVSAAKADLEQRVSELQTELDAKVLEAANEKQRADDITAWLEGEKAKAEQAAEIAARKTERLDAVKQAGVNFPEEYLEKNAERFAAMSEDDFTVALEGFKAMSKPSDTTIPGKTALLAGLESTDSGKPTSAVKSLIGARRGGRLDLQSL